MENKVYGVEFAPTAAAQKHALSMDRRPVLDAGIAKLALDPRQHPAWMTQDGTWRVRLDPELSLEYAILTFRLVIIVVDLTDDKERTPEYLL